MIKKQKGIGIFGVAVLFAGITMLTGVSLLSYLKQSSKAYSDSKYIYTAESLKGLKEKILYKNNNAGVYEGGVAYLTGFTTPSSLGFKVKDQWGTDILYCPFEYETATSSGNFIPVDKPILMESVAFAFISAGLDKKFNTTCNDALNNIKNGDDILVVAKFDDIYNKTPSSSSVSGVVSAMADLAELPLGVVKKGDVYSVTSDNSVVMWDGTQWVKILEAPKSSIIDVGNAGTIQCYLTDLNITYCAGNGIGTIPVEASIPNIKRIFYYPTERTYSSAMIFETLAGDLWLVGSSFDLYGFSKSVYSFEKGANWGTQNFGKILVARKNICGLSADGTLFCRGQNSLGELGLGHKEPVTSNWVSYPAPEQVIDFALSDQNLCVLTVSNKIYCSGENINWFNDVNNRTLIRSNIPVLIKGAYGAPVKIWGDVAGTGLCVDDSQSNKTKCIGNNYYGRFGIGNVSINGYLPDWTEYGNGFDFKEMRMGKFTIFGIKYDGSLWGSGNNAFCAITNSIGCTISASTPINMLGSSVSSVSFAANLMCAIANGKAFCRGYNNFGHIGDGTKVAPYSRGLEQASPIIPGF